MPCINYSSLIKTKNRVLDILLQKSSHVPKFGDWENDDNVPYTDYFENALKHKSGVKMNPNDPEENPEAFMAFNTRRAEKNTNINNITQPHNNNDNYHMIKGVRHLADRRSDKRINSAHQNVMGSYKSNTTTSESLSDDQESSSAYSLLDNRRARISRRKKSDGLAQGISSNGLPQLAQEHTSHTHTSGSNIVKHSSSTHNAVSFSFISQECTLLICYPSYLKLITISSSSFL